MNGPARRPRQVEELLWRSVPPKGQAVRWVWIAGAFLLIVAAVEWADQPPSAAGPDAPLTAFSEARAWPTVVHLSESIGHRVIGTPGRDAAAAWLVERLRTIPGVEVEVQDAEGGGYLPLTGNAAIRYEVRNVLARLPGDSSTAVLVSAHYDSPPESVGAGDNASGVAVALEALRALAAGSRLRHDVIVNFNDGEEAGLLGAAGFTDHPWIEDVRAFVNLESAGPGGKAILFQSGPGNPWLVQAYRRAAPRPYGTVLAQDLFQTGVIPSDTDFRIYRDLAGLRGLDIAFYQDGWAYHTDLDRAERIPSGSIQHMGDNVLALVRELASGPLPGDVSAEPAVYYDVLGRYMLAYGQETARLLAAFALLLAAISLVVAVRRGRASPRWILLGAGAGLVACGAGLVAALGGSLLLPYALARPHGWFATPALAAPAFGGLAGAGTLAVLAAWSRRWRRRGVPSERSAFGLWGGAVLLWAVVLAAATAGGLGAGYLALWWVAGLAAGLSVAAYRPERFGLALLLGFVPGAVLTAQVGLLLFKLGVPLAGRMPAPMAMDPVVAGLVALPLLALLLGALPALRRAGGLGAMALVLALVGALGLGALALRAPYTPERPKRVWVEHRETPDRAVLRFYGWDFPALAPALTGLAELRPSPVGPGEFAVHAYEREVEAGQLRPPAVRVDTVEVEPGTGARTVSVALRGGVYQQVLRIPREGLRGWSLSDTLPALREDQTHYVARFIGAPAEGWTATLSLGGEKPVEVEVAELVAPLHTAAVDAALRRLPPWTTAAAYGVQRETLRL